MGDEGLPAAHAAFVGVSLKMYFGHHQTLRWCRSVLDLARRHPALQAGLVELVVLPSFTAVSAVTELFAGSPVRVGAQDLSWEDSGALTGEVSGRELSELGCRFVEVGHTERRRLFAETDDTVRRKLAAAIRNDLTPLLCVGEEVVSTAEEATLRCISQLESALPRSGLAARLVVAYEPVWAIGAAAPASVPHIRAVCSGIRAWLDRLAVPTGWQVIYGGSAGVGLLSELGGSTNGLFLGRFAHDPASLDRILTEAEDLVAAASRERRAWPAE